LGLADNAGTVGSAVKEGTLAETSWLGMAVNSPGVEPDAVSAALASAMFVIEIATSSDPATPGSELAGAAETV
jgi:mannose/fructose/N-acetylgalactosamine-specific phosphotransferase system component IIC